MPSKNPATGKRYSGATQRKIAKVRQGTPVTLARRPVQPDPKSVLVGDDSFVALPPPPVAAGVDAVCSWASGVLGVAVAALSQGIDPKAVLVARSIKSLGKLTGRALRSEKALKLRQLRQGVPYDLALADCPADELARHAWAFARLALAIWGVATEPTLDEEQVHRFLMLVDALATFEKVSADASFSTLLAQLDGGD